MKVLKKCDYILIIVIFIIAISLNFAVTDVLNNPVTNGQVVIYYRNDIIKTLPLDEDTTYTIEAGNGVNTIEIKDNKVNMIDANCKDKLCVHEKQIQYNNQTIVCLPNMIVVKIESNDNSSEIDAIAR